ncbi:MAG: M15 family metallopeptidase domain-containing protein [Ignavibacteriaceae bacterium]
MNDSNDIGFNIRARILPQIEGVNELEQNLNNIIGQDGTPRANPGAGIPILPGAQSTETSGQNTQAALTPSQILLIEQTQEFLKRSGLEQSLKDIPSKMGQNISDVVSSPEFLKTLNPQQAKDAGEWLKYSQGLYDPLNDRIKETIQDLNVDLSAGKLTKGQEGKYLRKFERIKSATDEVGTNLTTDASSFFHPDQEHLEMIRSAISASKDDVGANIDEVKNKFIGLSTSINEVSKGTKEAHEQTQSFFQQFQKMGAFALGGEAVTSTLDYMNTTAEIAARNKTAFDLTSPMSMFTERTAFETWKDVKERTRDYELYGKLAGGVVGALIPGGGPLTMLVGEHFGGMAGGEIAKLSNTPEQAETQEQLKYLNQSYGAAAGLVESARPYEIAARQMDIRFGTNMRDTEGYLGYDADQYLKMRSALAEGLGRENTGLEKEQIAFARSTGLNPEDLAQFNVVQRLGGQNYNAQYLTSVEQMTKQEFGKDADNKRIIDVLEAIKEIQMKQLSLGVDSKTAIEFGRLPELLLGVNNPLGRMGDLGSQTLQSLSTLGTANSPAQEAMLYQALGKNGMFGEKGYLANKTRGFWDPENFKNIMETWGKDFAGNEKGAEAALFNYAPDMNAESRIKLARLIAGEKIDVVTSKKYENGNLLDTHEEFSMSDYLKRMTTEPAKQVTDEIKKMFGDASKSATEYETTEQQIRRTNLEAAEKFKDTILDSQRLQATFWNNMARSERLQEGILESVKKGYDQLNDWMIQHGFISDPKQIQEDYNNKRYNTLYNQATEMLGSNKYNPDDLKSQGKSIDDYEKYLAKYIFEHNPTYKLQASGDPNDPQGLKGQEYIFNRLKSNPKLEEYNKEEKDQLSLIQPSSNSSIKDAEKVRERFNNEKFNALYNKAAEELKGTKYNPDDLKSQGKSLDDYKDYLTKYVTEHSTTGKAIEYYKKELESALEKVNTAEQDKLSTIMTPDLGMSWRQDATKEINDSLPRGYRASISSGYRTPAENAMLPHSAPNSEHLIGYAEDLSITKDGKLLSNEDLYKDKAWWRATKELQKKDPDLDFGLFFKKNPIEESNHIQSKSHEESVSGKGSTSYNEGYENNIFSNRLNELTASISELSNRLGAVLDNKTKVDINVKSQDHFIEFQTKQVGVG